MPTSNLKRLVSDHCNDLKFTYGDRAITTGSAECRIFLNLIKTEGQLVYSGTLSIPGTVISGARGMPFRLVANPKSGTTDIVAIGRLADGGAFEFPVSYELLGTPCCLELNPVVPVRVRPIGLPQRTLQRSPRTTAGASSGQASFDDVINVSIRYVTLTIPTASIPYNLACIASWHKDTNKLISVTIIHLTRIEDSLFSQFRCESGTVMRGESESTLFIDAWPITTDPETRFLVTPQMMEELARKDEETASDVQRLIQDIQRDSGI